MANEPSSPGNNGQPLHRRARNLLIVEPQSLLRWSLATYLSRWFDVFPTDSPATAERILDDERIDAVVLSDALPAAQLTALLEHVRARGQATCLVCTVTGSGFMPVPHDKCHCIEKPFELRKLADLLGVESQASSRTR